MPAWTCSPTCWCAAGELDVAVVRSILETRLHNGPKVAELAAQRRGPELASLIDETVAALEAEGDPVNGSGTRWRSGITSSTAPTPSCSG